MVTTVRAFLRGARPVTLSLSCAPVLIAVLCARMDLYFSGIPIKKFDVMRIVLVLLVALSLQISANFANDYIDGLHGIDTDRISSAPRRLNVSDEGLAFARNCAISSTLIAIIAGLTIVSLSHQYWLLIVGGISVFTAWAYSAFLSSRGVGELLAFIFFGPVIVYSIEFFFIRTLGPFGIVAGLQCGVICAAVMLINDIRDEVSDAKTSKRTLVVRYGRTTGLRLLTILFSAIVVVNFSQTLGLLIGVSFHTSSWAVALLVIVLLSSLAIVIWCLRSVRLAKKYPMRYAVSFICVNLLMLLLLAQYMLIFLVSHSL